LTRRLFSFFNWVLLAEHALSGVKEQNRPVAVCRPNSLNFCSTSGSGLTKYGTNRRVRAVLECSILVSHTLFPAPNVISAEGYMFPKRLAFHLGNLMAILLLGGYFFKTP